MILNISVVLHFGIKKSILLPVQERKSERVYQKIRNKLGPYLRGAAHILDLGGTLGPKNPYEGLTPREKFDADARALRSDWEKVVGDFDTVLRKHGITPPERNKNIR